MQAVRGEQAAAADVFGPGHRAAGGSEFEVGVVVDGDPHGVAVDGGRAGRELGHRGVEALAQPRREGLDEFRGHGGRDRGSCWFM